MASKHDPIALSPFQTHFFYRERKDFSSKIYVSAELDTKLNLTLDEFKQKVVLPLLAKEPMLRTRIKLDNEGKPVMQLHDYDDFVQNGLIDDLLEETDLKIDSKAFLKRYTEKAFGCNDSLDKMSEQNWKLVLNLKENFISFVYSHVLFDGVSGVSVLDSCLQLLNNQELTACNDATISDNCCEFLDIYPRNKEIIDHSVSHTADENAPFFNIPNVFCKPWDFNDGCRLFSIQNPPFISNIIKKCKEHNVGLNSFIISMLALSTFEGTPLRCKFIMPVDLRERSKVNGKPVPKSTLGLLISFITPVTPKITAEEVVFDSESQWTFIKTVHDTIQEAIPKAVEDLSSFGNMALVDQDVFWETIKHKYENRDNGESADVPTLTFALSNLSLNFKFNSNNKFNVTKSVFSQCKRPFDYFSCSMVSTSQGLYLSFLHCEDENGLLEKCYLRFESLMHQRAEAV